MVFNAIMYPIWSAT